MNRAKQLASDLELKITLKRMPNISSFEHAADTRL